MEKNDLVRIIGMPSYYRGMFGRLIPFKNLQLESELEVVIGVQGNITHSIKDIRGKDFYRVDNAKFYYAENSLELRGENYDHDNRTAKEC